MHQVTLGSPVRHEANSARTLEQTDLHRLWVGDDQQFALLLYTLVSPFVKRRSLIEPDSSSRAKIQWDNGPSTRLSLCVGHCDYCCWWCYYSHLRPVGANEFCVNRHPPPHAKSYWVSSCLCFFLRLLCWTSCLLEAPINNKNGARMWDEAGRGSWKRRRWSLKKSRQVYKPSTPGMQEMSALNWSFSLYTWSL